jgi:hypothetical protein
MDLNLKNRALLSKWLFKLLTTEGKWQQLLRNKYLGSKPLVHVEWKPGDSHFWSGLMKVKQDFLRFGIFEIRNGSQVRFWEDRWLGGIALKTQYPSLYNIVRRKFETVETVLKSDNINLAWRRSLFGSKLVAWNELRQKLVNIPLTQDQDIFHWNLHPIGQFSVKSLYLALIKEEVPNLNKRLWRIKAPLKIKIFLWYLRRGVLLTKDNLAKRNWKGSKACNFCQGNETIQHLFFECRFARMVWSMMFWALGVPKPTSTSNMFGNWLSQFDKKLKNLALLGVATICWSLWLSRNDLVFQKKFNMSPLQVIFTTTHWLRSWVVLQRHDQQSIVMEASQRLEQVATKFLSQAHGWRSSRWIDIH